MLAPEWFRKSMQCSVGEKVRSGLVRDEIGRDASHPSNSDPLVLWPGGRQHSRFQELPLRLPPPQCQELAAEVVNRLSPLPHVPHSGLVPAHQLLIQPPQAQPLGRDHIPGVETIDTCVPGIGTGCPGQLRGEGAEQIEEGPGENDDVVDVQIGLDDHRCQTNAFRSGEGAGSSKRIHEINISPKKSPRNYQL